MCPKLGHSTLVMNLVESLPVSVGGDEGGDSTSPGVAHGEVDNEVEVLVGEVVSHTHHLPSHLVDILTTDKVCLGAVAPLKSFSLYAPSIC